MKRNTIALLASLAITLSGLTASAETPEPQAPQKTVKAPRMEVVFALDTTGSMGGLIQGAKEKIWSIAGSLAQADPAPEIRIGLVAYRDRGDIYVTKRTNLTQDLDKIYDELMDYTADGGGDTPESVNQALHEAVTKMDWTPEQDVYKVIFLVGDSPPKMSYKNDVKYPVSCRLATRKGIVINTIQCGNRGATTPFWKKIALKTSGAFNQIGQSGDAAIVSTPYDDELAELSAELDDTRMYYGSAKTKNAAKKKKERSNKIRRKASTSAKARRATYIVSKSGKKGHMGKGEIVEDISNGKVSLDDIAEDEIPDEMKRMSKEQRKSEVTKTAEKRSRLKKKIRDVSKKRSAYIEKEISNRKDKGKHTFSQKVFDSVTKQAEKKKIRFKSKKAKH